MLKYAPATALVIALNITMLTPAVSGAPPLVETLPRNEEACDSLAHGLRAYAIGCHCRFECYRQHSYYNYSACLNHTPPLCDRLVHRLVHPVEAVHACVATCVKAKGAEQHFF
jgi:hypothetical protein